MGKKIIMCFDGTSENFGPDPFTNVLKIYRLLDTKTQICYYQPGIGTSSDFDSVNTWSRYLSLSRIKNILDSMFAFCLDDHIVSAYLFLMKYYEINDQIIMFGFSRGAFIARVLAGMLERVGLLNLGLEDMVHMAWKIYENWEFAEQPVKPNYVTTLIQEFKRTFCRDYQINIHFQGLFDSVNSVGLFRDRLFPCTQRSNIIKHVRHAVSIDERRGKFKQVCFTPNPYEPMLFSLKYKPYELELLVKDVVMTTSTLTPMVKEYKNMSSRSDSVKKSFKPNCRNPLIEYTLNQSHTSNTSSQRSVIRDDNIEGSQLSTFSEETDLIQQINGFLSGNELLSVTSNNNKNVACSNKYIEGSFHISYFNPLSSEGNNGDTNYWMLEDNSDKNNYNTNNNNSSHSTISPDLIEKWFPGDHSDIGGGIFSDTGGSISNLSLRWMLAEAIRHGVKFKPGSISKFALKHSSRESLFACLHDFLNVKRTEWINSSGGSSEQMKKNEMSDLTINRLEFQDWIDQDFLQNQCDKISTWVSIFWWVLEFLPMGIRVEDESGKWRNRYIPNFGRSRCIPEYGEIHWSIIWIIKYNPEYRPRNLPRYVREVIMEKLNISLPSVKTLDTLTLDENDKRRKLYKLINGWIEDNWETVPDDLFELIEQDPTL